MSRGWQVFGKIMIPNSGHKSLPKDISVDLVEIERAEAAVKHLALESEVEAAVLVALKSVAFNLGQQMKPHRSRTGNAMVSFACKL